MAFYTSCEKHLVRKVISKLFLFIIWWILMQIKFKKIDFLITYIFWFYDF